jgi:hypothetical protein
MGEDRAVNVTFTDGQTRWAILRADGTYEVFQPAAPCRPGTPWWDDLQPLQREWLKLWNQSLWMAYDHMRIEVKNDG